MLVNELLKRPDPSSPFKGRFGMRKRVAWSQPVAIDDVKAIGAASGAKVNDVLVAAMTGALRSYLRRRGVDVDDTTVRAMVPVDLRRPERARRLGNEFGLVILDLAVASRRRKDRLAKTQTRMDALKRSPEAVAILALFNLFGRMPKAIEDLAIDLFGSKASVVMTNVVGPRTTLRFAGVPDRADDVLGAASGPAARAGREHPFLPGYGDAVGDRRCAARARSRGDHRGFQPRVHRDAATGAQGRGRSAAAEGRERPPRTRRGSSRRGASRPASPLSSGRPSPASAISRLTAPRRGCRSCSPAGCT